MSHSVTLAIKTGGIRKRSAGAAIEAIYIINLIKSIHYEKNWRD